MNRINLKAKSRPWMAAGAFVSGAAGTAGVVGLVARGSDLEAGMSALAVVLLMAVVSLVVLMVVENERERREHRDWAKNLARPRVGVSEVDPSDLSVVER